MAYYYVRRRTHSLIHALPRLHYYILRIYYRTMPDDACWLVTDQGSAVRLDPYQTCDD